MGTDGKLREEWDHGRKGSKCGANGFRCSGVYEHLDDHETNDEVLLEEPIPRGGDQLFHLEARPSP